MVQIQFLIPAVEYMFLNMFKYLYDPVY